MGLTFDENFRNVLEAERVSLTSRQSFEVHEAGHVSGGNDLGTCLMVIGKAIESHHAGDGLLRDRKGPPETAAFIRTGERNELDSRQMFEELTWLAEGVTDSFRAASESKFSQAVTTVVKSDGVGIVSFQRTDFQDIHQVFAEFEGPASDTFVIGFNRRVVEVFVVVLPHHGDATSRGGDDMVVFAEDPDEPFGEGPGGFRAAGVRHRLTAAGLGFGVIDLNAKAFQKLHRGKPDVRIKLIDEAGDKQSDARHVAGAFCRGLEEEQGEVSSSRSIGGAFQKLQPSVKDSPLDPGSGYHQRGLLTLS